MQNQDLERDFNNAQSDHERDSALWDEKREFLEKQKNQAKQDLSDAQRKFEITIEQLQKKDHNERSKNESAQMLLITSIEKKYKDQISDLKENHEVIMREKDLKFKELQGKLNQAPKNDYEHPYFELEQKCKDIVKNEKRLKGKQTIKSDLIP